MKPKMTLKRIARELDVSISTVSKALKDDKNISQETRERIQAFAQYYNYKPNSIALSLKNKRSNSIGLIIPEIVHHFFAKVISGIERVANERGYNVIIGVSNESFSKEIINMELLIDTNIDGFIMSLSKETLRLRDYHHIKETINQGVPVVLFDRAADEIHCDKVIIDDRQASREAVLRLLETGCRNIMLITTEDYITIGRLRTEGYMDALKEKGIPVREELIHRTDEPGDDIHEEEGLQAVVHRTLDEHPEIDAIFAVNEIYAVTALNAVRLRGLDVPGAFSVMSFSDGVLARHARPALSTVSQHAVQMGKEAAHLLINRLEAEEGQEPELVTRVIQSTIVERDTTRKKVASL
ncbi:LacI family DNA-binding transcriptional regulator [Robiginitalea sp. M366]|uniref:LacI family DNA-binding transcriptional regulator n=1 Tax=Robiginitalea aestuariiviva TaxID=3036903 RepID=UPI00240D1AEC|nr:LacI family DNA-binding transcriptional regulator [Robiginitalea aestuariiviva]MDG1571821.1 LacI family DNA-binding transcriptional regulator [Robiginitalea aestuariiviva]